MTSVFQLDTPKQNIQYNTSVMEYFCNMDRKILIKDHNEALQTLQQNSITEELSSEVDKQDCHGFYTSGIDRIVPIWDFKTLESFNQSLL